ncbi:MAG: peroxidase-related enzyme [Alphaproteobacteria bacterium]|nr:peroxidase-related enzyme [Alphaproteobacteria bacterium]
MSAWIRMIPLEEATGFLKQMYEKVRTPHGTVDNVMKVHSLRPHTMDGHWVLYKAALHCKDNSLPLWFLEAVGTYTSMINKCDYSFSNHFHNARVLMRDDARAERMKAAFAEGRPERVFQGKELALLRYAGKLTARPQDMDEGDIRAIRDAGGTDEEILEVNQVCAYFNYANRLLNGLGVTLQGDTVGYYTKG